jgi:hypothetical protein
MTDSPFADSHRLRSHTYDLFGRLRRRALATIAGMVAWLSWTLLYLAFWAHGFSLFQNIVAILVSLIVLFGLVVGLWVSYVMRRWWE